MQNDHTCMFSLISMCLLSFSWALHHWAWAAVLPLCLLHSLRPEIQPEGLPEHPVQQWVTICVYHITFLASTTFPACFDCHYFLFICMNTAVTPTSVAVVMPRPCPWTVRVASTTALSSTSCSTPLASTTSSVALTETSTSESCGRTFSLVCPTHPEPQCHQPFRFCTQILMQR